MLGAQLDAHTVVAAARQDAPPANWQVWRARRGFFVRQAILGATFVVLGAAGVVYLLANPTTAFVLGTYGSDQGGTLDPGTFQLVRVGDFVVVVALGVLGAYTLIRRAYEATAAAKQVLVLLPEGLVVGAGGSRALSALQRSLQRPRHSSPAAIGQRD
jgi:hypothetical protein